MAIERLAQYTAETRITTDLAVLFAGLPTIVSDTKYTGGYSYEMTSNKAPFGHSVVPGLSAVRFGWWQYNVTADIDDAAYLAYISNSAAQGFTVEHLQIRIDLGTSICSLKRPVTSSTYETLGTFTLPVEYTTTGSWFHVGYAIKLHATDGFFSMYIDGTRVFNYTGDTRLSRWTGSVQALTDTAIYWLGPGAGGTTGIQGFDDIRIDDMYFDSIIGEADAPLPARRFLMVVPTGAGVDTDWTPSTGTNWQNVDDNPNDASTTYNKAVDPDLRDTFVMGDIVLPADHRIVAAIPSPFVRKLDTEIDSQLSVHAWDGSDYNDSSDLSLTMSYNRPVFARLTTMPDGSDWDEAGFNGMQFGYQSRGEL